jgi:hypothetical protein
MRGKRSIVVLALVGVLWPLSASACTPIVPLVQLFGGPNLFAHSVVWMGGAVFIKCVAFALFERGLRWNEAVGFMIVGNVASTVAGIIITVPFVIPMFAPVTLPIALAFAAIPARRFAVYSILGKWTCKSRGQFAGTIFALMVATVFLWDLSWDIMAQHKFTLYWVIKFSYIFVALAVSMILTSIWEESVVWSLAKSRHAQESYFKSVMRANYVTFAVVVGATAIETLPTRLQTPEFLKLALHFFLGYGA